MYDAAGADELCFLDITASHENRDTILDVVSRTAARVFLPLTVGGGIRAIEDMRRLLLAGTDKCSINSAAVARPELVREAAQKFGSQCVVVAVDAKQIRRRPLGGVHPWRPPRHRHRRGRLVPPGGRTRRGGDPADQHGPRRHRPGLRPAAAARGVRARCGVPVIASGGVGTLQHFVEGAQAGATGLLAASVFHFGTFTIAQVKAALAAAGLPVRLPRQAA